MTGYSRWDIVLVRFPFSDLTTAKRRPGLVVSPDAYNAAGPDLVIELITSRLGVPPRPGDHRIRFWRESGLQKPSLLRMKLATIHREIVIKKIGRLFEAKHRDVLAALKEFFQHSWPLYFDRSWFRRILP